MSDVAWGWLMIAAGLVVILLSVLGRRDGFVDPMVDSVQRMSWYRDLHRSAAVLQLKAVLTMSAAFGALIVVLGIAGLFQS